MKKRWLIRSLFLLPLLCVVAVWVGSCFGRIDVEMAVGSRGLGLSSVQGLLSVQELPFRISRSHLDFKRGANADLWWRDHPTGLHIGRIFDIPGSLVLIFPLWLPTLLLLGLLWFVWRKTRTKVAGRAFPVEPKETHLPDARKEE